MRSIKFPVAIAALVFAGVGAIGCTNQDGAGGSSDGTSAEAYELNSEKNLAPSMDSVDTATPEVAPTKDSTVSGE